MKKITTILVCAFIISAATAIPCRSQAIADAIQQLALDYQKLAGMKSVLQEMYKGYEVVSKGYNSVKDISKGNFDLHDAFINGLMSVSPTVRKYPRISDIITDQETIVREYKSAAAGFRQDRHITPDEIGYMIDVYNNIISQSLDNIDELGMVITDNKLRMSDNERLQLIDRIYAAGHDQLAFLRQFNDHVKKIAAARARQANEQQTLKTLHGIR